MKALKTFEATRDWTDYDLVLLDIPPLPAVLPFARRASALGIPIIADFRDIRLPETRGPLSTWVSPRRRRASWLGRLSHELIAVSQRVIFTSSEARDLTRAHCQGVPDERFETITNAFMGIDPDWIETPSKTEYILLYTGSLAYRRDQLLISLLKAVALESAGKRKPFRLQVFGKPTAQVEEVAVQLGLGHHVILSGWVSRAETVQLQRECDALVLLQTTQKGSAEAIPGKLFEYMERRKPILSLATHGVNRIVHDYGLGVVATSHDPTGLAQDLSRLRSFLTTTPQLTKPPTAFSEETTVSELATIIQAVLGECCEPASSEGGTGSTG